MKRIFIVAMILLLLTSSFLAACDKKGDKKEVLYQYTTDKKANSIFDVDSLFDIEPQVKDAAVQYGPATGLKSFKFKSVGYESESKILDSTWVFAVIGVPNATAYKMPESGYPAVVLVHGGGGKVYTDWIRWWNNKGFIALAFDTYSQEIDKKGKLVENPEGGPVSTDGTLMDSVDNYENSWFYHNVINIIYCNNILRNRADVDKDRVCLTGISWGSVLCEAVSGIDDRFACFAPVYGSGFLYQDSNWIQESEKYGGKAFNNGNAEKWKELFDTPSYLPYCAKPVLFVSGIDDQCFSTVNRAKTYALTAGKRFYAQHYQLGHGHVWQKTPEICYFFRHVLYGEDYDLVGNVVSDNGIASVSYEKSTVSDVKFVYTCSKEKDSHKWRWSAIDALSESEEVYKAIIPDGVTAYYFEASHFDDEFYKTSTEITVLYGDNEFI